MLAPMRASIRSPEFRFWHGVPKRAIRPEAALADSRTGRRVLVYGDVEEDLLWRLRARGFRVSHPRSLAAAFAELASVKVHAVVTDATSEHGFALVRGLKQGSADPELPGPLRVAAERRHALTPVFLSAAEEYAIIVRPPWGSVLEQRSTLPLEDAVATLDVAELLASTTPAS